MSPNEAHLANSDGFMPGESGFLSEAEQERRERAASAKRFLDMILQFRAKNAEVRKSSAVVVSLLRQGYRYALPKCTTWSDALYVERDGKWLFVLFRKNGIDVRFFDSAAGVSFSPDSKVRLSGGLLLRMNYDDHRIDFSIHRMIRELIRYDFLVTKQRLTCAIDLLKPGGTSLVARRDILCGKI